MAFGAGVLISAVAFELVHEAFVTSAGDGGVALGLFAGCGVFFAGDSLIDRVGGADRKHSGGKQAAGSALAIVLGIVLDGIPESMVLGLTVLEAGSVSAALLVAVFLSNLPEAIAATTGLAQAGWARRRILGLWVLVMIVCGFAALAGYALFDTASPSTIAFVLAFAGGAILGRHRHQQLLPATRRPLPRRSRNSSRARSTPSGETRRRMRSTTGIRSSPTAARITGTAGLALFRRSQLEH